MKVLSVVGARPNLMKVSPLVRAVREHNREGASSGGVEHVLVHTGQHYDANMSRSFFHDLDIPEPDHYLGVGSGSHAYQVGQTMIEFEKVLLGERPDWVVVVGDVNATAACSFTAKKHCFRVAHIEAGLRSNDWSMPEELNRIVTDRISDLLLTPCRFSDKNLKNEGRPKKSIKRVGNIMIDTLEANRERAAAMDPSEVVSQSLMTSGPEDGKRTLEKNGYVLLTMHRPSNVDLPEVLGSLLNAFLEIAAELPVVFPVHPRTLRRLREFDLLESFTKSRDIILTEPMSYCGLLSLNMNARAVLTDSGGIQEESCVLGIPCLTMRLNTERPVTIEEHGGTCQLVGSDGRRLIQAFHRIDGLANKGHRPEMWDGKTAGRILHALLTWT